MKTNKITLIALLLMLAFSPRLKAQDNSLGKSVNAMIDSYLALKNALANNDGNTAEAKAKGLLATINTMPLKEMNAKQQSVWNTLEPKLEFDSRHISEVPRVPHQREHFASLSNNIYTVLKAFKLNKMVLYRQYCVMDKQTFISDAATGKDPYMAMDHCSKVSETLPAVR